MTVRSVLVIGSMMSVLLLGCTRDVTARPAGYEDYAAVLEGDMATVGSLRREVRQPAPLLIATEVSDLLSSGNAPKKSQDHKKHVKNASGKSDEGGFYKTYGSDADGEKGYLKKSFSKGDHGYKTLDTFHKKLGDRYGFEEHEAFGKESGKEEGKHKGKSAEYKSKHSDDDHEGAGTDVESHYADDEGDHSGYGGSSGEHYSGSGGDSSSYSDGGGEGYSESYSSGDGDGYGSSESYSSGGGSSSEEGDGGYY